jgi:magnesium transporter
VTTDTTQPTVQARLMRADGQFINDPGQAELDAAAAGDAPFWLDLDGVTAAHSDWLEHSLGVHPLVIDDAVHFGERPKLEQFDDYVAVVLYGAAAPSLSELTAAEASDRTAPADMTSQNATGEVHCIVSSRHMITVHRGTCAAIEDVAAKASAKTPPDSRSAVFYHVADALAKTFTPILAELDDRLDSIQGEIMQSPDKSQLDEVTGYRAALIALRKVVEPQTDIFATLSTGRVMIPGAGDEQLPYMRDVHDHFQKLSDQIGSFRDLIAGVTDVYMSQISNQLNVVMKQLSIIATIFLPLSFLTGFFGQNFGVITRNIGSWQSFVILGVGSEAVAVALLCRLFWRRGWMNRE